MSRPVASAALIGAVLVVAATSGVVALVGGGSSTTSEGRFRGSEPPAGITIGSFALRNYDGRPVGSATLRGRAVALTFLDSQCTESCPVIAWTLARALDALTPDERAQVAAVAITADPAEDDRASVEAFLARNRARGRLLYLGGGQSDDVLRRVWRGFSVLSSLESGEDTLHSAPVRVYDRDGVWVSTLHAGADLTEANLVHDLRLALGQ